MWLCSVALLPVVAVALQTVAPAQLSVRELKTADLKQVTSLRTTVFASHLSSPYSIYMQERLWEEAMANKTAVLVACATGELADSMRRQGFDGTSEPIVGSADMLLVPVEQHRCCYVTNVCVNPKARRRGVARHMMDAIDVRAAELAATALTLHVEESNAAAVGLYKSLGFSAITEHAMDTEVAGVGAAAVDAVFSTPKFVGDDPDQLDQLLMIKGVEATVDESLLSACDSEAAADDSFAEQVVEEEELLEDLMAWASAAGYEIS